MNQTARQSQLIPFKKRRSSPSLNSTARYLFQLYLFPFLIMGAVAIASLYAEIPVGNFMRDPSAIVELHSYDGIVSNLGALTWCAAATICLFAGFLLRRSNQRSSSADFLLLAGLFTTILMLDDLFLGHEKLEALGIPEQAVYVGYALFWGAVAIYHRQTILQSNYILLLVGIAFFGYSIGSDVAEGLIERVIGDWRVFFEDGSKFLGIVGWFGYFAHLGFTEAKKLLD